VPPFFIEYYGSSRGLETFSTEAIIRHIEEWPAGQTVGWPFDYANIDCNQTVLRVFTRLERELERRRRGEPFDECDYDPTHVDRYRNPSPRRRRSSSPGKPFGPTDLN
jgi:hypothetical protein